MFTGRIRGVLVSSALLLSAVAVTTVATPASATGSTVAGKVFQDTNVNGTNDAESGVQGVTVTAYDSSGSSVGSTTTGADGSYSLSVSSASGTPLRVEFTNTASRLQPSIIGTDNGGDVQFVNAGATAVNWALQMPGDACANLDIEPSLAVARTAPNGYQQGISNTKKGNCYLTSVFLASWSGHLPDTTGTTSNLLRHLDTGATYGLAFDKGFGQLWTSAIIRRHSGLGAQGVGGLYVTSSAGGLITSFNLEAAPWNLQLHDPSVDFSDAARGIDNTASPTYKPSGELDDQYLRSLDLQAFSAIGKQGIGDIAIESKSGSLYLTNLYQRKLQRLEISGTATAPTLGSTVTSWDMPGSLCPANYARPFGLYINPANDRPWVGIICTGENTATVTDPSADLSPQDGAFVYELNPTNGTWTKIVEVNLAYPHQNENCFAPYPYTPRPGTGDDWGCVWESWNDWTDDWAGHASVLTTNRQPLTRATWFAQPILAGIEQLSDGSLIIGLLDRWNFQLGWNNLQPRADAGITDTAQTLVDGDVLLLCKTANGYQQESNGTCTSTTRTYTAPQRSSQLPSMDPPAVAIDGNKEFFADNLEDPTGNTSDHLEMSMGALAVWPKTGPVEEQQVAFTSMDPWSEINTGGIRWDSADNGDALSGLILQPSGATAGFDKNAGLGGLEIVCDRAPLEIGNRAWRDDNKNGIQDVGEPPIVGATVHLYETDYVVDANGDPVAVPGKLVGTAVTDARGQYRFNSIISERAGGNGDAVGGGLEPNVPYMIMFDNAADFKASGPLFQLGGTVRGATATSGNSPAIDSNLVSMGYPTISVPATPGGAINHDYDAGFVQTQSIGSRVWVDGDSDGVQDPGEGGLGNVLVQLLNPDDTPALGLSGDPAYTVTDSKGNYVLGNVPPGDYKIRFVLPPGATFTTANEGDDKLDSDADADTGLTDVFTLGAAASGDTVAPGNPTHLLGTLSNPTIDAGVNVDPASLGGYVAFEGTETDGTDLGAPGLVGVLVYLTDPDGNPVTDLDGNEIPPTYTDSGGYYEFDNLVPGTYEVKFGPLPAGLEFSQRHAGSDRYDDSDAYPDGTTDSPVTVGPGDFEWAGDAIAHLTSLNEQDLYVRIGNYVWLDTDKDGVQDPGEQPMEGVVVRLLDPLGNEIDWTETDANGKYLFEYYFPGTYVVSFEPPNGYAATKVTQGADPTKDSDALLATSATAPFTVNAAAVGNTLKGGAGRDYQWYDETIDAGFYEVFVAIGDYVWIDRNADGIQDITEKPLAGVLVDLFNPDSTPATDKDGAPLPTQTTNAEGYYLFDNLRAGNYIVKFTLPSGWKFTSSFMSDDESIDSNADWYDDPLIGFSDEFTVWTRADGNTVVDTDPATEAVFVDPTIDAGVVLSSVAVGDRTWIDADGDGEQDENELPLPGVRVELRDAEGNPVTHLDGTPVDPVVTDQYGYYVFDDLAPGDYTIKFTLPLGYAFTYQENTDSPLDSNPDRSSGITPVFTLVDYVDGNMEALDDLALKAWFIDPTIDAGVVPVVAVGDYVWVDTDRDGLQDGDERPLASVGVEILDEFGDPVYDAQGIPVGMVFTDANGHYLFDNLTPGNYQIGFTLPPGYLFTDQFTAGDGTDDSNPDPETSWTPVFSIAPSAMDDTVEDTDPTTLAKFVNPTIDAGVVPVVAVGNYVWFDRDADGVQDATELGIGGVTVSLTDSSGNPVYDAYGNEVFSTTTDDHGKYLFDSLLPGTYKILFEPPAGYEFTGQTVGANGAIDSNASVADGWTGTFTIAGGVAGDTVADSDPNTDAAFINPTIDAGVIGPKVAVGDYTWLDANRDGIQDAGELPLAGVKVELLDVDGRPVYNASGVLVPSVTTNAQGHYLFDNLNPGQYRVRFTAPAGYGLTTQFGDGSTSADDSNAEVPGGLTPVFTVYPSSYDDTEADTNGATQAVFVNPTIDAGYVPVVAVGNYVWFDANKNGLQDLGETPVRWTRVTILTPAGDPVYDASGAEVLPQYTDASGAYLFDNLLPGTYRMLFEPPAGYTFTDALQGAISAIDSNADQFTGLTDEFEIAGGVAGDTIADTAWWTRAQFVNPTIDAGLVPVVAMGDYVWVDTNRNGLQDLTERGLAGVEVTLLNPDGTAAIDASGEEVQPVYTDNFGKYLIDNLLPGSYRARFVLPDGYTFTGQEVGLVRSTDSNANTATGETNVFQIGTVAFGDTIADTDPSTAAILVNPTIDAGVVTPAVAVGDYVWFDTDADGEQDGDEPGIAGVKVELLDPAGNPVYNMLGQPVASQTTGSNGLYLFDNLPAGQYRVRFTPPAGKTFTIQFASGVDSADDSNAGPSTGLTPVFSVFPSATDDTVADSDPGTAATFVNPTIDAGFVPVVAVGDIVWIDSDRDGIQDVGEAPLPGATVELYDSDGNPALDAEGTAVPSQTTTAAGKYLFDNLRPGTYMVKFTPPAGYVLTDQYEGADGAKDSNADPSTGWTDLFDIASSATDDTVVDSDVATRAVFVNPTIDAGVVPVVAIGNYTWVDTDADGVQDLGCGYKPDSNLRTQGIVNPIDCEPRLAGVMVELLDAAGDPAFDVDGNEVAPVFTDLDGRYVFDNLLPGDYRVRFTLPDGYQFTTQAAGANTTVDSNPVQSGPDAGLTPVFTVNGSASGNTYTDISADTLAVLVDPTIDAGVVSGPVAVGNYVWFDANGNGLQDADEAPIAGVGVELTTAAGDPVYDMTGTLVGPQTTDAYGAYLFQNLPTGQYRIKFTAPEGYVPTQQTCAGCNQAKDSNAAPVTGLTPVFTLLSAVAGDMVENIDNMVTADYVNPTIDAGFVPVVALGSLVWLDKDADGIQDAGEPGLGNVKVELTDPFGEPVLDADGEPVDPIYTDADGEYLFDNLLPGTYRVRFTPQAGSQFTLRTAGAVSALDSDAYASGWTPPFTIGSSANGDTIADTDGATRAAFVNPTIDAGIVSHPVAISGPVWFDLNADGVQDSDETSIPGVRVQLLDFLGNPVTDYDGNPVATLTTDSSGRYTFDNLKPGSYQIQFTPPPGYAVTQPRTGESTDDSNPNPGGRTPIFDVAAGVGGDTDANRDGALEALFINPTIGAGIVPIVAVGDIAWVDSNGNGLQDVAERGLAGVKVTLADADGNPVTDNNGITVAPVFTDAAGRYLFDNLRPGDYQIKFEAPLGSPLTYDFVGGSRGLDSNADRATGWTSVFTIAYAVSGDTVADTNPFTLAIFVNPTIDVGIYLVDYIIPPTK